MGKRRILKTGVIILLFLLIIAGGYLALTCYYQNRFAPGTWINGIYCTGMDPGRAQKALREQEEPYVFCLYDQSGKENRITGGDIGLRTDYSAELSEILKGQSHQNWLSSYFHAGEHRLHPQVSFDGGLLREKVVDFTFVKKAGTAAAARSGIVRKPEGYELLEEGVDVLDRKMLCESVERAVSEGIRELSLNELHVFRAAAPDRDRMAVRELYRKIDLLQSAEVTYVIGDREEKLTRDVIADFIRTDEDGGFVLGEDKNPVLDEKKIRDYAGSLADKYDTVGASRVWNKTSGGTVVVEGGTFGAEIDEKAEARKLLEDIGAGRSTRRSPVYKKTQSGVKNGEIGNTFIEIDMTAQMLYYYVNGNLYTQTAVVTGNTSKKRSTPARVCYVYNKQKSRVLRGPGYASFVSYWMPVMGNIGLHDASWRREFGGDIYKTAGSHGCINLPKDEARKIFEKVQVGTPVVMYY